MAPTPHVVAVETTSRPRQCGYEASQLRLERRLHAGSPHWGNNLVSAGPVVAIEGAGAGVGRLPGPARLGGFRLEGLDPGTFALLLGLGKCEMRIGVNCTEYQG